MTTIVSFPTFPRGKDSEVEAWADDLVTSLQTTLLDALRQAGTGYTVTGYTATRTLDNTAPSVTTIGNVLCTLIADLRAAARIG